MRPSLELVSATPCTCVIVSAGEDDELRKKVELKNEIQSLAWLLFGVASGKGVSSQSCLLPALVF
eukprot:1916708-Amphidinium_carterae.1